MWYLGILKQKGKGKETYGFKTRMCPGPVQELKEFEKNLWTIVNNIEFRTVKNSFQNQMKTDIKNIKQSGKVIVPADKSTNLYKVSAEEYEKAMLENITTTYKKSNEEKVSEINKGAYSIAKKLDLDDRMKCLQQCETQITIKDHKPNFPARVTHRLINPSKTDLGRISKIVIDKINTQLLQKLNVNQWKNTHSVIKWFNAIPNKGDCTFVQFDIDSFYPSITLSLFEKVIKFAKQHVSIKKEEIDIIKQSRKTLLFYKEEPWTKKNSDTDFDVPMGSYDGAELCELVGTFLLSEILKEDLCDKSNMGLYRDDGLLLFRGKSGPEIERTKKAIIKVFQKHELKITTEPTTKSVQYLDVEFNLDEGTHKPFRKPNSVIQYVNKSSNHPPSVLKQIPNGIAHRLSTISSNQEIFENSTREYNAALKNSGYEGNLEYSPPDNEEQKKIENAHKKARKRKVIYYNPPFSLNVKTNIGREFLKLIKRSFPSEHKLRKIFNKNTLKLSYCCMKNMASIIRNHNKSVLNHKEEREDEVLCNCRKKEECPLQNKCLKKNIIYQASVKTLRDGEIKEYIGCTSTTFKIRYGNHKKGFQNDKYITDSELAKYVNKLVKSGTEHKISWRIMKEVRGKFVRNQCKLCVVEAMMISEHPDPNRLLNPIPIFKCVHERKHMLRSMAKQTTLLE